MNTHFTTWLYSAKRTQGSRNLEPRGSRPAHLGAGPSVPPITSRALLTVLRRSSLPSLTLPPHLTTRLTSKLGSQAMCVMEGMHQLKDVVKSRHASDACSGTAIPRRPRCCDTAKSITDCLLNIFFPYGDGTSSRFSTLIPRVLE